jgi:hypothetical protein
LFDDLKFLQNGIGSVPSAFDCFLAIRGVKTLHIRMREHERNALKVREEGEGERMGRSGERRRGWEKRGERVEGRKEVRRD